MKRHMIALLLIALAVHAVTASDTAPSTPTKGAQRAERAFPLTQDQIRSIFDKMSEDGLNSQNVSVDSINDYSNKYFEVELTRKEAETFRRLATEIIAEKNNALAAKQQAEEERSTQRRGYVTQSPFHIPGLQSHSKEEVDSTIAALSVTKTSAAAASSRRAKSPWADRWDTVATGARNTYEYAHKNPGTAAAGSVLTAFVVDQIVAYLRGENSLSWQAIQALYRLAVGSKVDTNKELTEAFVQLIEAEEEARREGQARIAEEAV